MREVYASVKDAQINKAKKAARMDGVYIFAMAICSLFGYIAIAA